MKWKTPPKIKIYEALGSIADKRIEIKDNKATVFSSSRNKAYTVTYNPDTKTITSNDNGSYWVGYLGYPAITFLMLKGTIPYKKEYSEALKDIPWKDLVVKFKSNYEKTIEHVHEILKERNINIQEFLQEIEKIYEIIKTLDLNKPKELMKPPEGY